MKKRKKTKRSDRPETTLGNINVENFVNRGVHGELLGTMPYKYLEGTPDVLIYDIRMKEHVGLLYPDKARMVFHISTVQASIDRFQATKTQTIKKRESRRKKRVPITI